MKNFYILIILSFSVSTVLAQKNATDLLDVPVVAPPVRAPGPGVSAAASLTVANQKPVNNLVSRPSFKRIFEKDFSALSGVNTLPLNQFILSLNDPEIQIGQLINLYAGPTKSIPVLGLYPYIKGKLNKNDEFKVLKNREIDPGIDFGGKLTFNLYGLSRNTGYYFNPADEEVKLFVMKTNAVKTKISLEYSRVAIDGKIAKLRSAIDGDLRKIDSLKLSANPAGSNDSEIASLQEKVFENSIELKPLLDLAKSEVKRRKFIAEKVFDAEKDAPWKFRKFIWLTLEGNTGNQSVNIFRNNAIEEDQNFRKNTFGLSGNYSTFGKRCAFNAFIKYERSFTNKFLADDEVTLVSDSLTAGGKYKISTSTEVYDVSKLSDAEFARKSGDNILTIGSTILWGEIKKWGFTGSYKSELSTHITNVKLGLVIPVILDSEKAEQSNIILEMVMPDIHTKSAANIKNKAETGQTVTGRTYFNLKVGIPINVL